MKTIASMKLYSKHQLREHLKQLLNSDYDVYRYADGIAYDIFIRDILPGDSIWYEIPKAHTKSGNPEIVELSESDFIYHEYKD